MAVTQWYDWSSPMQQGPLRTIHHQEQCKQGCVLFLNAKLKHLHKFIQEALFADNRTLLAHKNNELQMMFDRFSAAFKALTYHQSRNDWGAISPDTTARDPSINFNGILIKNPDSFNYLRSIISSDGWIGSANKAGQTLERLHKVHNQLSIKLSTKLKVYKTFVLEGRKNNSFVGF